MIDTTGIDEAITSLYETVSGPAGAERDWEKERNYQHPEARLIRTSVDDEGRPAMNIMTLDGYVENTREFFHENDFYEVEVARRLDVFGNVAHAWSTYEARHQPNDQKPFMRGINSIQLFNDGERWRILHVLWDNEREGNPLPERNES